ncbi:hypothetical protein ESCNG_170023 [Neisseria gonorrhoeae]|uniref:Secreted protein n=1 Tax=Neisseria gonorrhoeae TaxID=485 RepID=A0AB74ESV5_NEIGO|nr:hypothetical protein ESCNG_160031 [Neisseria gonorrhoeae]SCW10688.1 hypothetical protein ESCNG_150023 [Neisseria gonorrhoeae]SCW10895.1 hypothetical protein ESCNG_170023 [Neisseria gonorrhoeae]SCW11879.1 hypothetical protein ESCNG_210019 [Neisseria gonorrhoeae]SCW13673.1 hypothetical protein ESCNG_210023 [Neisseria gonorrhoeae]
MENSLIIGLALAVLLMLLVMRAKQGKKTPKRKSQGVGNTQGQPPGSNDSDWVDQTWSIGFRRHATRLVLERKCRDRIRRRIRARSRSAYGVSGL